MGNKAIITIIALAFILMAMHQAQALGVTRPAPYDIQLMKGESAGFVFEIQAVTSTERQACSYSISGMAPLQVAFEENEALVDAGAIKQVYGTVTAPEDAEIKTYSGTLSVSCGAFSEGQVSGSAVKTTVGGSPFNVKVVEERSQEIRNVAPPEPGFDYTTIIIIIAVIIIVAIAAGVYYKRKHSGKAK
jgi:hypothetical protein